MSGNLILTADFGPQLAALLLTTAIVMLEARFAYSLTQPRCDFIVAEPVLQYPARMDSYETIYGRKAIDHHPLYAPAADKAPLYDYGWMRNNQNAY
jgi:hypothetical protein